MLCNMCGKDIGAQTGYCPECAQELKRQREIEQKVEEETIQEEVPTLWESLLEILGSRSFLLSLGLFVVFAVLSVLSRLAMPHIGLANCMLFAACVSLAIFAAALAILIWMEIFLEEPFMSIVCFTGIGLLYPVIAYPDRTLGKFIALVLSKIVMLALAYVFVTRTMLYPHHLVMDFFSRGEIRARVGAGDFMYQSDEGFMDKLRQMEYFKSEGLAGAIPR